MKSGNLNFLDSSGPLQACKGSALLLKLKYVKVSSLIGYYTLLIGINFTDVSKKSAPSSLWLIRPLDYHYYNSQQLITS